MSRGEIRGRMKDYYILSLYLRLLFRNQHNGNGSQTIYHSVSLVREIHSLPAVHFMINTVRIFLAISSFP
jgi:hypothetical protein